AATATIRGAELQIGWRPIAGLSFDAGASYVPTARYDSFPSGTTFAPRAGGLGAALTILDLSGTRMIRTPKFTGNVGINYGFDVGGGKVALSGSYFYNSGFYWVPAGVVRQPSYNIVNGKASWTDPSEKWTLSVWGRNLAGEVYYQSTAVSTGGFVGSFAEPRTIGIGVEYKF
ncbi:MAG: TonB-dependent receptor, partial [Acetobacteraceae bacterium]